MALKQKQRDEQKALKEAKEKAAKKGPLCMLQATSFIKPTACLVYIKESDV